MKQVGILGLGRFGKLLVNILEPHFILKTYDPISDGNSTLEEVLEQSVIFIAVPIHCFQSTIEKIAPQLVTGTTIIDLCSVKIYPVKIMEQFLGSDIDIIATHPLFGPDSFTDCKHTKKIMLYCVRNQYQQYHFWKDFFNRNGITVVEMTPEQHDLYMAQSQGVTHLIGRTLAKMKATETPIDTSGYDQLLGIMKHTCNDTWALFSDLQHYNPYSDSENQKLTAALRETLLALQKNYF